MSLNLRLILIAGSALFFCVTLYLIYNKRMDLNNSIRWFAGAVILILMALFPDALEHICRWVGISVPSNLVFFVGIAYLLWTSISFSAEISRQHETIKKLTQRYALLEKRLRDIEDGLQDTQEESDNVSTGEMRP